MRDKLTRREDRALLKALREIVLTQYPNPERKDCPGTSVLRAIATKRINMFDPAHEHVPNCSPCFKELTDIQQRLRRRNVVLWAVATAGTAIVTLAVLIPYFGLRQNTPIKSETVQKERPVEPPATTQRDVPIQSVSPEPPQPAQPVYEAALLDLRNASAVRAIERPDSDKENVIDLPRGLLRLTVQLPVGSDAGSYEIQIRDSSENQVRTARGPAIIEDGITKLSVNLDTRSIQPGQYQFAWRLADFSWRQHLIRIR